MRPLNVFRLILYSLIFFLFTLCLFFALLQTSWAREEIQRQLARFFATYGIVAQVNELRGTLPFSWEIHRLQLEREGEFQADFKEIKWRIAFFPLLRGKFSMSYLHVHEGIVKTEPQYDHFKKIPLLPLTIHRLRIDDFAYSSPFTSLIPFALEGNLVTSSHKGKVDLHLRGYLPNKTLPLISIDIEGNRSANHLTAKLTTHSFPFSFTRIQGMISSEGNLSGPWTTWEGLLEGKKETTPLLGKIKGSLFHLLFPSTLDKEQTVSFLSQISISEFSAIHVDNLLVSNDLIHLKGKGILHSEVEKSQAFLAFSLPDLSAIFPSFPIQGKIQGKGDYRELKVKIDVNSQELSIHSFPANTVRALIKAKKSYSQQDQLLYKGEVELSSSNAQIPFHTTLQVEWCPNFYTSFPAFHIQIPEGELEGGATFSPQHFLVDGFIKGNINHLQRFSFWEPEIDGNVSCECRAWTVNQEQHLTGSIFTDHFRYQQFFLNQCHAEGELHNLFSLPKGKIHLNLDHLYSPRGTIHQLTFGTTSEETSWPFYLTVAGELNSPFHCSAQGVWKNQDVKKEIKLSQCSGEISSIPFHLDTPSLFEWSSNSTQLKDFQCTIGEGFLHTEFALSPADSMIHWEAKHFPLEVFQFVRPSLALKGIFFSDGTFIGSDDYLKGELYATTYLEKPPLFASTDELGLQAKGTLKVHVDNGHLQAIGTLQTVDSQVLDFQALLPIQYQPYPPRLHLDKTKSVFAEMICEGAFESLCGLIQFGSHHVTGLVSGRLFLSNTLETPFLQGNLHWQEGTYENDTTGISLRNIHATFHAHQDEINLTTLTAQDEQKGTLELEGKVLLNPQKHFPFSFIAEQTDLYAIDLNRIHCHLTGPVYITGNTQGALAQGNLLVNRATIPLTEPLPVTPPSLPITFIHRPPHLLSTTLPPPHLFPFHIDFDLTAHDKVYVKGIGLNAELQGNVHITGIHPNIVANGSLELIKGEYQFSGKVFKLTEGEVIFKDKPTPSSYLNLNGTLSLPSATITAMLRGPLAHPQLSFESNPQMSTSSILALILFNKEISDISHPEAIQLANTLMSLSGGAGPDVLETIRKSIGVDRLNIVSASPGSDQLAIQIGKYLTKGIMVTLSQSATSSQVTVEVELPKGFVFKAETQEEQEGKFSLQWTASY